MRRTGRRSGFTLVEVLVATALAALLIGIIVMSVMQAEAAMQASIARQVATQQVRALFTQIEIDLNNMVPCVQAAAPLQQDARNPANPQLPIDLTLSASDPNPSLDVLRLYTTVDTVTGAINRAVVEYSYDGFPGAPTLTQPLAGGPPLAHLRRHILTQAAPGSGVAIPEASPFIGVPILLDCLISMTVEYLPPGQQSYLSQGTQVAFERPDASTQYGQAFVLSGTFDLGLAAGAGVSPAPGQDPFSVRADNNAGILLLTALPLGGRLLLPVDPAGLVLTPFAIRAVVATQGGHDHWGNAVTQSTQVVMNNRIDNPQTNFNTSAFVGPSLIRVTVVVPFAAGPQGQQARFEREFAVPKSS